MVESGPAAGVISAAHLGELQNYPNLISFDMGGTTAKTALVQDGTPRVTKDYEVGAAAGVESGSSRAAGFPIRTPVIDLVEIGAGGGSIAWVDSGGSLRVGPRSAGADPGPVCYGKGGKEPTITDANVVMGRLSPGYFLGGEMPLNVEAATEAIEEKCARPLGMEVMEAAHGIVEIANAAMVNALRLVSVQRGFDPRDFILVAFGGAGPVHANKLAAETSIPKTLIPMSPGIFSAVGLLVTNLQQEDATTMIERTNALDLEVINGLFERMEQKGMAAIAREGVDQDRVDCVRRVDMRYVGQSYELAIPVPGGSLAEAQIAQVVAHFHAEHDRAYGFSAPEEPAEFVNLRVTTTGRITKPQRRKLEAHTGDVDAASKGNRSVYFPESGGFVETPIFDRYRLGAQATIAGPAIVEEIDSTTVIHPGYSADVDEVGNLILTEAS